MRQTLFFIPHWLFEGPLLIAWLVIGLIVLAVLYSKYGNSSDTWSFLPVLGIVAAVIHFVLPGLEVAGINPADPSGDQILLGLAIRGYGVFLLGAIAVGLVVVFGRAKHVGLTFDQILGLVFWMIVIGIAGARLFYVIQKSDEFFESGLSFGQTMIAVINMTQGGLVVYGSLIGGILAAVVYLKINRLPILKTADLIAPGMVLGLAIGRIGCLMNGCCYGGVCEAPLPSVTFPAGSSPYMTQLYKGELIGVKVTTNPEPKTRYPYVAESIQAGSLAALAGLQVGDPFSIQPPDGTLLRYQKESGNQKVAGKDLVGFLRIQRLDHEIPLPAVELPARSLNTHPTQIYASINALLLGLVLWFFWTVKRYDGEVFALMLILYSIGRFMMELIRQDELGQFGTPFTISQLVSFGTIL
ncbi:MAG: phosphatidylglycerol:prolipoprotein diacylglycerol transferase, partial [Mariniblastus sp.]